MDFEDELFDELNRVSGGYLDFTKVEEGVYSLRTDGGEDTEYDWQDDVNDSLGRHARFDGATLLAVLKTLPDYYDDDHTGEVYDSKYGCWGYDPCQKCNGTGSRTPGRSDCRKCDGTGRVKTGEDSYRHDGDARVIVEAYEKVNPLPDVTRSEKKAGPADDELIADADELIIDDDAELAELDGLFIIDDE